MDLQVFHPDLQSFCIVAYFCYPSSGLKSLLSFFVLGQGPFTLILSVPLTCCCWMLRFGIFFMDREGFFAQKITGIWLIRFSEIIRLSCSILDAVCS